MEPNHSTPPPLVSTGVSADVGVARPSTSNLPVMAPGSTRPSTNPVGAPTDLIQFQQMLVDAMRDPRVRAVDFPGPSPAAHGELLKIHYLDSQLLHIGYTRTTIGG